MANPQVVQHDNTRPFWPSIFLGTSQKVTVGASSTQSAAVQSKLVRIFSNVDCFIATGTNPTAVADGTNMIIPAGFVEYIAINVGDKIAVIQSASGGFLYITGAA